MSRSNIKGGTSYLTRKPTHSNVLQNAISTAMLVDKTRDPVHRMSLISPGDCFVLNGVHFE